MAIGKNEGPGENSRQGLMFLGSPTWARTRDLRINSPALYQLSYRGTAQHYKGPVSLTQPSNWTVRRALLGASGNR